MQKDAIKKYARGTVGPVLVFGLSLISAVSTASAPGFVSDVVIRASEYQEQRVDSELDLSVVEFTQSFSQK